MYRRNLLLLTIITTNILSVICAPTQTQEPNTVHDYSKFDAVYDQRQNGSENYKLNVDGVVVVWTSPETALSALTLLELGQLDGEYPELEELLSPQKPPKPENLLVISPEKPSSSTTTSLPPSLVTEGGSEGGVQEVQNGTARHEHEVVKRKRVVPIFMRPFLPRRHVPT